MNQALHNRLIATDSGWKTVRAFPKVSSRRKEAFLSLEQRRQLLDACDEDLRLLVKGLLLTVQGQANLLSLMPAALINDLGH